VLLKALITFSAGVVAFLSPCVLPLLPAYVGYMTGAGASATPERSGGVDRPPVRKALPGTLAFVAGLTVVFVALGATASELSQLLNTHKRPLEIASGALVIALGVLMLLQDRIPFLIRERRFHIRPSAGVPQTFLLGAAFAFAWTPCIGFTLGAAMNLAATSQGLFRGIVLLFAYSLGLGLPFIAAGLGLLSFGGRLKRHAATIQTVGAIILICVGILMITGRLTLITIDAQRLMSRVHLDFWNF
jgi:cytochrome c-type biogenesis protein